MLDGFRWRPHALPARGLGPALILLHGLLGYSFSWRYTIPALAPYATVYAPDLLGAGFSDRPRGIDHSMHGTALRVLRFVDKLGLESFDLLGTSRGGAVAMAAAAECVSAGGSRRGLRRLVLVCPVNPYSPHGTWLAPFFGTTFGASAVSLWIGTHAVSVSLLARAPVWRPQQDSAGKPGGLQGAAGDSGIVRPCAEHCPHLDGGSAGTGSVAADAGVRFPRC